MISHTIIQDLTDERLIPYFSLNESQLFHYYEPEPGLFIAESAKVISRALKAGYEPESFLVESDILTGQVPSEADREILLLLQDYPDTPIYALPKATLRHIPGYAVTRGLSACLRRKKTVSINTLCADKNRIVVLESVDNPSNIGAIFRSAAALFMEGVLLTNDCSDPLYKRAARVSMGCVFQIPYTYYPQNAKTHYIDELHKLGYRVAALALTDRCISITDEKPKQEEKLAILMGSEGHGLSAETIQKADYVVKIPMAEGIDSLNVAAASTLAFWELGKH